MTKPYSKKQIISHLNILSNRWNKRYWLYVGDGTLHLLKKNKDGTIKVDENDNISQEAIVDSFYGIDADGGGW